MGARPNGFVGARLSPQCSRTQKARGVRSAAMLARCGWGQPRSFGWGFAASRACSASGQAANDRFDDSDAFLRFVPAQVERRQYPQNLVARRDQQHSRLMKLIGELG